jgi:protein O-mannosyl-transferase
MKPGNKKLTKKEKFRKNRPENSGKNIPVISSGFSKYLPAFIIVIFSFLLYANTLSHDFALDDYSVIIENTITRQGMDAIPEIFTTSHRQGYYSGGGELYRPLTKALFAIEWEVAPGSAYPGHIINVLLYCLTGFILFFTMLKLTGGITNLAFMISVLFMAHPIHTEVVANIKSLDEILSFLFGIWSLERFYTYLTTKNFKNLLASLLLFFLGLLSKESTITYLALFPLVGWTFAKTTIKDTLIKSLPFIIVAGLFLLVRSIVLSDHIISEISVADNLLMAANSITERIATTILILGIYLKLMLFPHPLVFDYSYNQIPITGFLDLRVILSLFIYLALIIFALIKIRSRNMIAFGILFFLISFSIFSNVFITIGSSLGERFLYAPVLGFCIVLSSLLKNAKLNSKQDLNTGAAGILNINFKSPAWVIFFIVTILYSFKTVSRNVVWQNNKTLYTNDIQTSPNSTRMQYYMGNMLVKKESWGSGSEEEKRIAIKEAINYLNRSIEIYPQFSDAHLQLGVAYYHLQEYEKALKSYLKAYKLNSTNPTTNNNIGTIYFQRTEYMEALKYFLAAIKLNPSYAEAYANAGSIYGVLKKYDQAINMFDKAVEIDPSYAQAYYFLGVTYRSKGLESQAQFYLNKAAALNPAYSTPPN